MAIQEGTVKEWRGKQYVYRFGQWWSANAPEPLLHLLAIRKGGTWFTPSGTKAGLGLYEHYKQLILSLWPDKVKWHKWADIILRSYLEHSYIAIMGCAASGKTFTMACIALADWWVAPDKTSIICSSTTLASLDMRIWGVIYSLFKDAKERYPFLPGKPSIARRWIVLNDIEDDNPKAFKNGIVCVPCKHGDKWVGLGPYVGIHNERVRLIADEANLMPRAFLDADSNLSKCHDYKLVAMGNPTDAETAHGILCEPVDGWDSKPDYEPITKTWPIKYSRNGICIHLPGPDTPNKDTPPGQPYPFPFLITPKQIEEDQKKYSKDDILYLSMVQAVMPRGGLSKRILTRPLCEACRAFDPPKWAFPNNVITIAGLDAAYGGVGGSRCVLALIDVGLEKCSDTEYMNVVSIKDIHIIPIQDTLKYGPPELQIAEQVKQICIANKVPPQRFFFDAGMRASLVSTLANVWSPLVQPVDCGGKPSDEPVASNINIPAKDYYTKKTAELWYTVRLIVQNGQFRNMREDVLREFAAREFSITTNNKIDLETKQAMMQRTGISPDIADAVAIAIYGARKLGFVIGQKRSHVNLNPYALAHIKQLQYQLWHKDTLSYNILAT